MKISCSTDLGFSRPVGVYHGPLGSGHRSRDAVGTHGRGGGRARGHASRASSASSAHGAAAAAHAAETAATAAAEEVAGVHHEAVPAEGPSCFWA